MASRNKCWRLPIVVFLLFGSAQPSPNFLACTVTVYNITRANAPKDDCCRETEAQSSRLNPQCESFKAHKYFPCCESVIPFTSIAEHQRVSVQPESKFVSLLPEMQFPRLQLRTFGWKDVPSPTDVGKEILTLNLRI